MVVQIILYINQGEADIPIQFEIRIIGLNIFTLEAS